MERCSALSNIAASRNPFFFILPHGQEKYNLQFAARQEKRKGQPERPPNTISISQVLLLCQQENVHQGRKSVFYTNAVSSLYIILHIENLKNLWYLISTKRWYQCTGKSWRLKAKQKAKCMTMEKHPHCIQVPGWPSEGKQHEERSNGNYLDIDYAKTKAQS